MNPEAKKELDRILEKAKTDPLEDYELDFLRARQVYLKKSQLEYLEERDISLKMTKGEEKKRAKKVIAQAEQDERDADEANRLAHPAEKKEQLPYGELQDKAKGLGLKFAGIKRAVLEKAIVIKEKEEKEKGKGKGKGKE